jgi:CRP/FNR family cyclic AMP-dependent transcriptional regulator
MSGADTLETLRAIPLFSHVVEADLEQIASHLIERRYPRNTTIVEEGLPGDYMYILREGRVKVTKLSEDGREKILDFLDVGAFVGEMALLERAPRSASVKTLSAVRVLALSRADFMGLLRKSPDLALAVIGLLDRLAKDTTGAGDRRATPALTHQQIADMIGTSRETVTRVVKELKASGWLQQEGKRYLIPTT